MAKKQTRRSISVSRGTYERLKAYCETNEISMSQFVERRVGDYLGRSGPSTLQPASLVPSAPQRQATIELVPVAPIIPKPAAPAPRPSINQPISQAVSVPRDIVSKPLSDEPLLKDPDANLTADQIFTF